MKKLVTKLNRDLTRDNRLVFDLSDEELELFNERFNQYRSNNRSAFIRESVLNDYLIINDDTNLRELVYEVNRIGNNVNQLAKIAQKNKNIEVEEIEQLKKQMKEIRKEVFDSLMKHNKKR